jgi:very-short-patch-repair endonuclease
MPRSRRTLPISLLALVEQQAGVVSRGQLLAHGLPESVARDQIRAGRWRRLHPGIWATFTGPPTSRARIWAAVLAGGPGAAVAGRAALFLAGVVDQLPAGLIEVAIPHPRRVRSHTGIRVIRRRDLERVALVTTSPPRIALEAAVVDLADGLRRPDEVIDLVIGVVQARRSTAQRLRLELASRSRHRWRALLGEVLGDVEAGVQSPLERRYLLDVAQAHGLPAAEHNHRDADDAGSARYRDAAYLDWGVIAELDGRAAHPAEQAFRDRRRDNGVAVAGGVTLRYGWTEVVTDACGVAAEIAGVLRARGWQGTLRACGPGCGVTEGSRSGPGTIPVPRGRGSSPVSSR